MRRFDSPYVADWFAISLRWIVLVGMLVSLALRDQVNTVTLTVPGAMVLWNGVLSVLAGLSIRFRFHRQVSLAVDFLLAAFFFYLLGGLDGASAWIGLYPIFTAAVYFEMWGAFGTAGLFALWQFIVSRESFANGLAFSA